MDSATYRRFAAVLDNYRALLWLPIGPHPWYREQVGPWRRNLEECLNAAIWAAWSARRSLPEIEALRDALGAA